MNELKFLKSEHEKIQKEIISESQDVKLLNKSYYFGAASVLFSIYDWCDLLDKHEIKSVTSEDIKKSFDDWIINSDEIKELLDRLNEGE
jgi:hypothetical protein